MGIIVIPEALSGVVLAVRANSVSSVMVVSLMRRVMVLGSENGG